MGNICCQFFTSFTSNPDDSIPHLILYRKIDLSVDQCSSVTPNKTLENNVLQSESTLSNDIIQSPTTPYIVVWLCVNADADQNTLSHLRRIVYSLRVFSRMEEFLVFSSKVKEERLVVILSGIFIENVISSIQQISQSVAIYILVDALRKNQEYLDRYDKIQEIFTAIEPLCEQLKRRIHLPEKDMLHLELLNPSSIVLQYLIKQMLLVEINCSEKLKRDFLHSVREEYSTELNVIDEFEETYTASSAIRWFTRNCFLSNTMRNACQTENIRVLIQMAFFIQDLHRSSAQSKNCHSIVVYRGQGLLENQFEMIKTNLHGLFSFKNFLHTNTDRTMSLNNAHLARNNPNYLGVLLRIEVLSVISEKETNIDDYFFPIYTRFRIGSMIEIEERIWQIDLFPVEDDDQQLKEYLQSIENGHEYTVWQQLGHFFIQINQIDQGIEFYQILLEFNLLNQPEHLAYLHEQLAILSQTKNHFTDALLHYKKSLKAYRTILSGNDPSLFKTYLNIGVLCYQHKHTTKAIQYLKSALNIALRSSSIDPLQIPTIYEYIGDVYEEREMFLDAIQNYQSTLEHLLNHRPLSSSLIVKIYSKIGHTFYRMDDCQRALSYYTKTLQIQKKSLSPNHIDMADTNYRIALTLNGLQQHKEAIEYASQALNIARHAFGFNHDYVRLYEEYLDKLRQKTFVGVIPNGSVYE